MVVRLEKNASQKQVKEVLSKVKAAPKPFDISKFAGKVKWGQDALEFQRELRGND
jgi:hypothetical protein